MVTALIHYIPYITSRGALTVTSRLNLHGDWSRWGPTITTWGLTLRTDDGCHLRSGLGLIHQDYSNVIEKEGEYSTMDLCSIFTYKVVSQIVLQHHIYSSCIIPELVLYSTWGLATCPQTARTEASSLWISLQRSWPPQSVATQAHGEVGYTPSLSLLYTLDLTLRTDLQGYHTNQDLSGVSTRWCNPLLCS